ncbi:hypothetical protein GGR52DRAFT_581937 [Hypoxylon sp. FL1284]|nr:hypothetical protein GGR52DRAFT_581937 [Hypoxylon sp. FL1284]
MEDIHKLDPSGDVVLTLRNPNAPFAVWTGIEDDLPAPLEASTIQNTAASSDPWIEGHGKKKRRKNRRTSSGSKPDVDAPAEPVPEPPMEPSFVSEVAADASTEFEPDEAGPSAEATLEPGPNAVDALAELEPASLASPFCSTLSSRDQSEIRMRLSCGSPAALLRLSSRHLTLASLFFEKSFRHNWQENTRVPGSGHLIYTEDWGTEALLTLMRIIHGRIRLDYYKCHEVVELVVESWIKKLQWSLPQRYCRDLILWLFISWVFSEADIFRAVTKIAVNETDGPLPTLNLPIPEILVEAIDRKRRESIEHIITGLHNFQSDLRNDRAGCSFECSSILLGALIKETNAKGCFGVCLGSSMRGLSVKATTNAVLEIRSPQFLDFSPEELRWKPEIDEKYAR